MENRFTNSPVNEEELPNTVKVKGRHLESLLCLHLQVTNSARRQPTHLEQKDNKYTGCWSFSRLIQHHARQERNIQLYHLEPMWGRVERRFQLGYRFSHSFLSFLLEPVLGQCGGDRLNWRQPLKLAGRKTKTETKPLPTTEVHINHIKLYYGPGRISVVFQCSLAPHLHKSADTSSNHRQSQQIACSLPGTIGTVGVLAVDYKGNSIKND